jgi:hypothetical protein
VGTAHHFSRKMATLWWAVPTLHGILQQKLTRVLIRQSIAQSRHFPETAIINKRQYPLSTKSRTERKVWNASPPIGIEKSAWTSVGNLLSYRPHEPLFIADFIGVVGGRLCQPRPIPDL